MESTSPTTIEELAPVTAQEVVNGSYEALKAVMATYMAQFLATDPLHARQLATHLANEVDSARVQFILAVRENEANVTIVEGEVVDGETEDS